LIKLTLAEQRVLRWLEDHLDDQTSEKV